jgi:uncharacterized surface protein with fasciclin (FAS1) repeats
MRAVAVLPIFAVGALGQAQNATYLAGLVQALTNANLTSLAATAAAINSTDLGKYLLAALPNGPLTIFAPTNDAFANVPSSVANDTQLLADIIAYHVLPGNYSGVAATAPNVTIGPTLLNDSSLVHLEGNKSQVIAWQAQSDQKVHILNQATDVTVQSTAAYQNIVLNVIDQVLSIPGNISTVLSDNANLTSLATVASGIPGVLDAVSSLRGFTLFAPNNDAIAAASSALAALAGQNSVLTTIILNHLVNGSTIYSPSVSPTANLTSAAGEPITFQVNSTGTYVITGNNVASGKLVRTDVLVDRGVIHIIDGVLANTASNATAASAAYASATSIAGKPTSSGGAAASASSSSKPTSAAVGLGASSAMAGFVAVFGALVGGLLVL